MTNYLEQITNTRRTNRTAETLLGHKIVMFHVYKFYGSYAPPPYIYMTINYICTYQHLTVLFFSNSAPLWGIYNKPSKSSRSFKDKYNGTIDFLLAFTCNVCPNSAPSQDISFQNLGELTYFFCTIQPNSFSLVRRCNLSTTTIIEKQMRRIDASTYTAQCHCKHSWQI